jgi:hypothetical protein
MSALRPAFLLSTILLSLLALGTVQRTVAVSQPLDMASQKLVLAAYLNHWQNSTGHWRWDGWAWDDCGEAHDPSHVGAGGLRDIASIYYPLIGPYDDRDPAVQQYHVRLAKASGIDAFIVDWYGMTSHGDFPVIDRNFQSMLRYAESHNFGLAVDYYAYAFYLGGASPTVSAEFTNRTEAIRQVHDDLAHVIQQYGPSPAYVKFNGKPVIFVFASQALSPSEWTEIVKALHAEGLEAFFIRFSSDFRFRPAFNTFFPWIGAHEVVLDHYDPIAWINGRAEELRSHDLQVGLNVWPGFDSTPVADWCYGLGKIQIDRQNGLLYNRTWNAAIKNSPQWIEVATFNDWNEGTIVEPTQQFRYRYLYATAYYSAQFKHETPTYDGILVPLAIYNATLALHQAQADGRTTGFDSANQTLGLAEEAFEAAEYSSALAYATQAQQLANHAQIPQASTTRAATSSTTQVSLQPVTSSSGWNVSLGVTVLGFVALVAISVIVTTRKRQRTKNQ